MNKVFYKILLPFIFFTTGVYSQEPEKALADSFMFKGLLSSYAHYNPDNIPKLWAGARYIPQINYNIKLKKGMLIDFEASANLYGNVGMSAHDTSTANGDIKPYRLWARYSGNQFELRVGLQKINFGSASMLRPLMWFDQIDPRDPLRLTDGVWGVLGRYYFLNNLNIWAWVLYGNDNLKGWETVKTRADFPEMGGRIQTPLPRGEAAVSYHFRQADMDDDTYPSSYGEIPENRIGFDARFDLAIGCWIEGSWIHKGEDLGPLTNQEIINLGADYTLGLGNGLYIVYEHLLASADPKPFEFSNTLQFSLLSLSYPIGLFDNLSAILYYDWTNENVYSFLNWQRQFDNLTLYLMGYWNPRDYYIPSQGTDQTLFAGRGIQVMLVFNH